MGKHKHCHHDGRGKFAMKVAGKAMKVAGKSAMKVAPKNKKKVNVNPTEAEWVAMSPDEQAAALSDAHADGLTTYIHCYIYT